MKWVVIVCNTGQGSYGYPRMEALHFRTKKAAELAAKLYQKVGGVEAIIVRD